MALDAVKILLVEDDPVFRTIVATFLRGRGALVTEASDGQIALTEFFENTFDVVISDITMPNMDGLELLSELANAGSYVPSIVMSGNQKMSNVSSALQLGASDFLVKPISDLYQIEQAIFDSLQNSQLDDGSVTRDINELSYVELNQNLSLLEHNANAARSVQQQLFPSSAVSYKQALFEYSLFTGNNVTPYFIDSDRLDNGQLLMYMAHFYPEDNRAAFGSVLLRSFIEHSIVESKQNKTDLVEPCKVLEYLNQRLVQASMGIYADIIMVIYEPETKTVRVAQAGAGLRCYLRRTDELTTMMLPTAIQLGLVEWGDCHGHVRQLEDDEQLCVSSANEAHKSLLLQNHFAGIDYRPELAAGGYFQLSVNG